MVDEGGAHTREVDSHVDTELSQVLGRADARAHEEGGAGIRARGQHDPVGIDDLSVGEAHAARSSPHQLDTVDEDIGADVEVGPVARRGEMGERRTHAERPLHVPGGGTGAHRARAIVVLDQGVTAGHGGVEEGALQWFQVRDGRPADRDRPGGTVPFVCELGVGFAGPEHRQKVGEGPSGAAGLSPRIEVGRPSAHGKGGIGRGTPAHEAGPGELGRSPELVGHGHESPVVADGRHPRVGHV